MFECLSPTGENDLLCEVETSLPTTGVTSEQAQGRADSGIELDDFPSPSLTSASKRRETEDSEEDESASNTKTAEKIPLTREHSLPLSNKNTAVKGHRRSHSHDFFRESPAKSAVCAHRRTSSGHYLGHRRALSSDYQVDQSVDTKELTHKSASKLALFGHRRTGSGASRTSQGLCGI